MMASLYQLMITDLLQCRMRLKLRMIRYDDALLHVQQRLELVFLLNNLFFMVVELRGVIFCYDSLRLLVQFLVLLFLLLFTQLLMLHHCDLLLYSLAAGYGCNGRRSWWGKGYNRSGNTLDFCFFRLGHT